MCLSPTRIDADTEVPCRLCWQCRAARVNDLVGRCLAEQETSDQTLAVTLTYCGDTPHAVILAYRDVQLFLKRLHKAGYDARYIVAGEYGESKGRAHWHIILFLKGKTFEIVEVGQRENDWQVVLPRFKDDSGARIQWAPWSNPDQNRGHCYIQNPDYGGFRYLMKYVLKPDGEMGVKKIQMSKYPPLGHDYFMAMADDLVDQSLPVQLPTYQFGHVKDANGKFLTFCLRGRMRELFLDRYRTMWRLVHGTAEPQSEWYAEKYDEKVEAARLIEWTDAMSDEYEDMVILPMINGLRRDALEKSEQFKKRQWKQLEHWIRICPEWLPRALTVHRFTHKGNPAKIECVDYTYAEIDLGGGGAIWRVEKADLDNVVQQLLQTELRRSALKRVSSWLLFLWSPEFREYWDLYLSVPQSPLRQR